MQPAAILFGALFTVATALALGKLLFRAVRLAASPLEEWTLALPVGGACLSALVFLAAVLKLARPGVFLTLGAAALAGAVWARVWKTGSAAAPLPRSWRILGIAAAIPFTILYFFNAMAPESSPDGSSYHLALVGLYARSHALVFVPTNMYAQISQGMEMLYLFAYTFGKHSAAAMVHFAFLASLALMLVAFGRRAGQPGAGICAAVLVYASPVVGVDGVSAYNDLGLAAVLFALFYLLELWRESREWRLTAPAGLLAGFAFAIKYTAFPAAAFLLGTIVWVQWRARKPWWRETALAISCAALMVAPWVLKNWLWTGNPLSPFYNAWFPNPYVHVSFETTYRYMMRHYEGLKSYWSIPKELFLRGAVLQGLLGPAFLLAPAALLALKKPLGRRVVLAAAVFGVTYWTNVGTRFLIPCLPFVALAMAMPLARIPRLAAAVAILHAILSWPAAIPLYASPWVWRLRDIPWKAALRITPEDAFLRERLGNYAAARLIEERVPEGRRVLAFSGPATAYTTREVIVGYQGGLNNTADDLFWSPVHSGWIPTGRLRFRFEAAGYEAFRVVYKGPAVPEGDWTVNEFRVLMGAAELPREPEWRLRARPNPWDVQAAFDNSPVTRWRSWEAMRPGMYVEADFRSPRKADTVVIECGRDQLGAPVRLEGRKPGQQWKTIAEEPERSEAPASGLWKRAAMREIKALGIDYLLADSEAIAKQIEKPWQWGLIKTGEVNGVSLYRVE